MKRWVLVTLAGAIMLVVAPAAAQQASLAVVISVEGAVDPLAARYVERSLARAEADDAAVAVIRLDTPGGLDSSMRDIVEAVASARVPVVCWVGPSGARAASAGAIIAMGCPFTSMAPGTAIGAAHPVGFRGEVLDEKITNDAAAYARSLAQTWGHDPSFAERMVRASESITATEAQQRRVVDSVRPSIAALLESIDGLPTEKPASPGLFATAGARVSESSMTFLESVLHRAVDPNLAFLLFVLGLAGIVFEVLHPGISVPGIVGGLSFLVSLVILGMLPVNITGIVLLLIGVGAFVAEAHAPGFGAPAAIGFASLLLGGLFLFDASVPGAQVSRALVIATALAVGAIFACIVRAALKTRHQLPVAAQTSDLIGELGVVTQVLDPGGIVRARRESWTARSVDGATIAVGSQIRVAEIDGLTLIVEPAHQMQTEGGAK
jgi:membrane-bound serine protease (ClpP class)